MKRKGRAEKAGDREETGLVFGWSGREGAFWRTFAGVLVAVGVFVALTSVFQVRGKTIHIPSRESARVMVLLPDDPGSRELFEWAKRQSPFPDNWEPNSERTLKAEMGKLTSSLEEEARYQPLLRPMPEPVAERSLPGLFRPEAPRLPMLGRNAPEEVNAPRPTKIRVVARAGGTLRERWGELAVDWPRQDAPALLGAEASFVVGVDPGGAVSFCLLMEGVDAQFGVDLDRDIERWLRRHRSLPVVEGENVVWDTVRVRIGAPDSANPGEKP